MTIADEILALMQANEDLGMTQRVHQSWLDKLVKNTLSNAKGIEATAEDDLVEIKIPVGSAKESDVEDLFSKVKKRFSKYNVDNDGLDKGKKQYILYLEK